jgi:hypothetical protein
MGRRAFQCAKWRGRRNGGGTEREAVGEPSSSDEVRFLQSTSVDTGITGAGPLRASSQGSRAEVGCCLRAHTVPCEIGSSGSSWGRE